MPTETAFILAGVNVLNGSISAGHGQNVLVIQIAVSPYIDKCRVDGAIISSAIYVEDQTKKAAFLASISRIWLPSIPQQNS